MILDALIDLDSATTGARSRFAIEAKLVFEDRRDLDDAKDLRLAVLGVAVRRGEGWTWVVDWRYEIRVEGLNSHSRIRGRSFSSSEMMNR